MFEEYQDIKNDFIALLNYTIGGLDSINPGLELLTKDFPQNSKKHINKLREQLKMVTPGEDEFSDYEDVCVKILKELFSENLRLWKKQVKSNQDLYRFDLCCKIKHGEDSEFFQTIKNYFNTKYIIFEFKNYKNKITQREVYTTEKYLYKTALRSVAIILSRKGADENAHIAARGCLRENGKLILFLSDEDIIKLIDLKTIGEKPVVKALSDMLDEMLINLEK